MIFAAALIKEIYNKQAGYDDIESMFKALLGCKHYCDKNQIELTAYSAAEDSQFSSFSTYQIPDGYISNICKLPVTKVTIIKTM